MEETMCIGDWNEQSTKIVLCDRNCNETPENCPFVNFNADACSVVKTKSKTIFRRVKNAIATRGDGVRSFYCKCSRKEHTVSGKMQEHINRRELPKLNYPGGENESNYLREQRRDHLEIRGAC